ncbi:14 kDa proline-rich protein DC2.15-like [Quercus lobata]|uniref:14 kDa proline-rich protein DC2.15-like n=1 Tax=Quercus lobata TaxID=97700 RepID=UPI00124843CF|nr:14 kDa proline-rich protein DC2.15-like [Quercus lobata]
MASKAIATMAFLLSLNLLFFTMVTSTNVACPPPLKTPKHTPQHSQPNLPTNKPATCPKDTLKLGVCANLLNDLVHLVVGTKVFKPGPFIEP